ncbi:MAG: ASKHA domain-containing protein [Chloroflexota bacterium]
MAEHTVTFDVTEKAVAVPTGTLLTEAARLADVALNQPCGGQGRCGRCAVQVTAGTVRRRSTLRLSAEDVAQGYALACQSVVEEDVAIHVPPQEQLERRLTTDRTAAEVTIPAGYDPLTAQPIRRLYLTLTPPSMDDQTDDWNRLQRALRQDGGIESPQISLALLRKMGRILRQDDWRVTAVLHTEPTPSPILIDLLPGHVDVPLHGLAIDIGTTTVTVWLVNLLTGQVLAQASEYNRQIQRGEDVISRIIYASKNGGSNEMQELVLSSINTLIERVCQKSAVDNRQSSVVKATITGNSTMIHLLLGISAESIRLSPFVTAVNQPPTLTAAEIGLDIHPAALIDCIPGVASYVGADISAGVLSSSMDDSDITSLFMDVGTNGEIVLGSHDWLVTCACSAGPAFEGAGVLDGMRATRGAIEEIWINNDTYEPAYRVIGEVKPRGLCGSGLISLLAEMFLTGIVDKGGNVNLTLPTTRTRLGEHGPEYVIAWGSETQSGKDIVITRVDIDNLLRAKAAIYAGFSVLATSIGFPLEAIERVLIGGSFGKYINVEKAVQIGLLPDLPWEQFHFLGNTSVLGAYLALIDQQARARIADIAGRMTYVELSADNSFYEAFTSALFLPHTDLHRFPSVAAALAQETS